MPRVSDVLNRFRPSGAPGSATKAGVPADRTRDVAEELEPVFAGLVQTEAECRRIVEDGQRRAAQVRSRDAAAVERLLATAAPRVAAERARAAAAAHGSLGALSAQVDTDIEAQVAGLRTRLEEQLPVWCDDVAAAVRDLLDTGTGGPTAPGATS